MATNFAHVIKLASGSGVNQSSLCLDGGGLEFTEFWNSGKDVKGLMHLTRSARLRSSLTARTMATSAQAIPHTIPLPGGIPDTHRPHTEQTTTILVPKENTAFLNPVQEYNRDLSVASIRTWNQMRLVESELRWRKRLERDNAKGKKKAGKKGGAEGTNGQVEAVVEGEETPAAGSSTEVSDK